MNRYSVTILDKETLAKVGSACVTAYGIREAKIKALIEAKLLTKKKDLVLSCTKLRRLA